MSPKVINAMTKIDEVLSRYEVIDFDYLANRTIVKITSDDFLKLYNELYGIKNVDMCIQELNYTEQLDFLEIEWKDDATDYVRYII